MLSGGGVPGPDRENKAKVRYRGLSRWKQPIQGLHNFCLLLGGDVGSSRGGSGAIAHLGSFRTLILLAFLTIAPIPKLVPYTAFGGLSSSGCYCS